MLRSSKKDLKTKGLKRMPQMGHDSHDLQNTRSSILHFLEKKNRRSNKLVGRNNDVNTQNHETLILR